MKLSSFAVIEVSLILMLSSRDAKLSSWAVAELSVVVVVVVAATQVAAVVVAATQVTFVVVATTQVAAVAVVSQNWKIQSSSPNSMSRLRHRT
jgi:hypothetical protein